QPDVQLLPTVTRTPNATLSPYTTLFRSRNGVNIAGATGSTYTVVEADEGALLRVIETATDNDGGPSVTSTSAPTAAVSDITLARSEEHTSALQSRENLVCRLLLEKHNDS